MGLGSVRRAWHRQAPSRLHPPIHPGFRPRRRLVCFFFGAAYAAGVGGTGSALAIAVLAKASRMLRRVTIATTLCWHQVTTDGACRQRLVARVPCCICDIGGRGIGGFRSSLPHADCGTVRRAAAVRRYAGFCASFKRTRPAREISLRRRHLARRRERGRKLHLRVERVRLGFHLGARRSGRARHRACTGAQRGAQACARCRAPSFRRSCRLQRSATHRRTRYLSARIERHLFAAAHDRRDRARAWRAVG